MAFKKGVSGNPKGKPKNSLNKKTIAQREAFDTIMELIEARLTNGDDVINNLSVGRAADLYVALVNYRKPKLNSNTNSDKVEHSGGFEITVKYESDFDNLIETGDEDNDGE